MAFAVLPAPPAAASSRSEVYGRRWFGPRARPQRRRHAAEPAPSSSVFASSERLVSVVGASGEVGRKVVEALLRQPEFRVRAVVRSEAKARGLFGDAVEYAAVDVFDPASSKRGLAGSDAVVCCLGTTAFPTKKWAGGNTPERVDLVAVRNVAESCPDGLQDFMLHSSIGVLRRNVLPFSLLNAFKVLEYKYRGEEEVKRVAGERGFAYTIVRPGQLNDEKPCPPESLVLSKGDHVSGLVSREQVAAVMAEALRLGAARNEAFEIVGDPSFHREGFSYEGLLATLGASGDELLRLNFAAVDPARLVAWLEGWGATVNERHPGLEAPVMSTPTAAGVELAMLAAGTLAGGEAVEVATAGRILVELEAGRDLVVRRGRWGGPLPGEKQLVQLFIDDLQRVVSQ